jgi:hypothetical protein
VELLCVHSPLPLLNSKNLVSQNNSAGCTAYQMRRREAPWKTINIQSKTFRPKRVPTCIA